MPVSTSIGQRFTQLIQQLGMSKNAFAQSLDKTATVIQHLVDERNKPGYDLLCKVFEVYPNVSKDWLLLGQGSMMVGEKAPAEPAATVVQAPTPPAVPDLFVAPEPAEPLLTPLAAPAPEPAPVIADALPQPAPAPVPAASPAPMPAASPAPAVAPDPTYLAVALQTQHLQHQLALAEQRNRHLLEQQTLMQQLVAVLQRGN
jgi:plasmid maintenance system antidote protein VapI